MRVLVISVGVDQHIRSVSECVVHSGSKRLREAPGAAVSNYCIDTVRLCNRDGVVCRSVVDDHDLDRFEAFDLPGNCLEDLGEGFPLVEARNLNDKLHQDSQPAVSTSLVGSSQFFFSARRRLFVRAPAEGIVENL